MRAASTLSIRAAGRLATTVATGVASHHALDPGADQGRVRAHQGQRLPLHVRTHQRAVRIVVL